MDEIVDGNIFVAYNEGCSGDAVVFIGCIIVLIRSSFIEVSFCIPPPSEVAMWGSTFPVHSPSEDTKDEDGDSSIIGLSVGVVSLCSIFAISINAPFADKDVDGKNGFLLW